MNPFIWIRRKAAESIALGVSDGLLALTPEGETPPTDLAGLRAMLAAAVEPKAIAAHDDESPKKRGR